jgi:branched-chain amino acid transport system permease protein
VQFVDIYIVPGLVIGCIYAIAASGLVMTYSTSGVLNVGYGSVAYAVALIFYELRTEHDVLGGWAALALCVLVVGPAIGLALWHGLFRWLAPLGLVATLIASIGVAVALPALCELIFQPHRGDGIAFARGVPDSGSDLHTIGSIVFTVDQAYAAGAAVVVAVLLAYLLRGTRAGLRMRAVFDDRAVAALTGASPAAASNLSWAIGGALAAIGGVFLAPVLSLDASVFLTLTAASLAAALVGGLRSIPIVFAAALVMGVASSAITGANATSTLLAKGVQPSIPFAVMAAVVLLRRHPIAVGRAGGATLERPERLEGVASAAARALPAAAIVALAPLALNTYWTGVVGLGLIYGVIFLGLTIAVGFGGMLSLGQAGLAGLACFAAGDIAASTGMSIIAAMLLGALLAAAVGAMLAFVGGRLDTLEFGLLTLAFGLFVDNFLYHWTVLVPLTGTPFPAPSLLGVTASSTTAQYYVFAGVLGAALLVVAWYRRRVGAFLAGATRMRPGLAAATGIAPLTTRVAAFTAAAFVTGIGGCLLGIYQKHLDLTSTDATTTNGLVWLAVMVFMGIRSPGAVVAGGIAYALFPALLLEWLPESWGPLATVLFGLGALALAQNPRGAVAAQREQAAAVAARLRSATARAWARA